MERKIGEIFKHGDEWYQCVESSGCALCAFNETDCNDIDTGSCEVSSRSDGKSVVFKRLEKVGESYNIGKKVFQRYEVFIKPYIFNDEFFTINTPVEDLYISIEIQQIKEDMKEQETKSLPIPEGWEFAGYENGEVKIRRVEQELPTDYEKALGAVRVSEIRSLLVPSGMY